MTARVDWNVLSDSENVRHRAIELRAIVAERIYLTPFQTRTGAAQFLRSPRTIWRRRAIDKAELFLGRELAGTVLEIGAGTAWCSALVSLKSRVRKVFALDYDRVSVDEIMPKCFENLDADVGKITRALGSFNATKLADDSVDAVISIGAVHHSESLASTFKEALRILRPGGILVASEPCEPDSLKNAERQAIENKQIDPEHAKKLYGEDIGEVREADNSDHNYRLVDYISSALGAGFDIFPYTFQYSDPIADKDAVPEASFDRFFVERICYDGFKKIVLPPYFAQGYPDKNVLFDPLLLILQKPS